MNSPLGRYSQIVAAIVAVGIIALWAFVETLQAIGIVRLSPEGLRTAALLALGAVFGSAATINGVKAPLDSAHSRIDKIETVTGIQTHGAYVPAREGTARGGDAHDSTTAGRDDPTLPPDPPPVT